MPAAYAAPPKQLHGALFSGQSTAQAAAAPSHAPPVAASQVGIPAHGYAAEQNARFREYMEDDRAVVEGFGGRADRLFAAVYDGHGGRLAVDFITARLHEVLAAELRASRLASLTAATQGMYDMQFGAGQIGNKRRRRTLRRNVRDVLS